MRFLSGEYACKRFLTTLRRTWRKKPKYIVDGLFAFRAKPSFPISYGSEVIARCATPSKAQLVTRSHSNSKNVTFLRIANTRRKSQKSSRARVVMILMIHVMLWFFHLNNCFYNRPGAPFTCALSLLGSFVPGSFFVSRDNVCCPFLLIENALLLLSRGILRRHYCCY